MAQEFVITIRADASAQEVSPKTPDTASNDDGSTASIRSSGSGKSKQSNLETTITKYFGAKAAYNYAKQAVDTMAALSVNTVELRTGHAQQQQRQQFIYDRAKTAWNIGESAAIGFFATGGNPIGAVVGGAIGLASKGLNYLLSKQQIEMQRSYESIGLMQANIRAGTGGDRVGKNTI